MREHRAPGLLYAPALPWMKSEHGMTHRNPVTFFPLAAVTSLAALLGASCTPVCGTFDFELPETRLRDDRVPPRAYELCGDDTGTQGNWEEGPEGSIIAFQPSDPGLDANFVYTNMLISLVFRTSKAVAGATLTGGDLGGNAFFGLGVEHTDESPLLREESSLTIHSVGEETGEGLFRRRIVDLSWDLVWSNGKARWAAKGRDAVPMLRSTR